MEYSISHPPTSRPFSLLTRQEARTYYDWFVSQISARIAILETAVQSSSGEYRAWHADKTPESLGVLGQWFVEHITTRPFDQEDRRRAMTALNRDVPPQYWAIFEQPDYLLTTETHSLIIDVGMYLGEVFRNRYPQLRWKLYTRGKYRAGYQEPVLARFGLKQICSPVDLVHGFALKAAEQKAQASGLRDLFEYWSSYVEAPDGGL